MAQKKRKKANSSQGGKYLNPPFDPRILKIGAPGLGSAKLQRGRLVAATANSTTGQMHGVHFLYNPVAVTASHNVNVYAENTTQFAAPNPGTNTQLGTLADIGGVDVSLLYDRTYELWDKSKKNTLAGRFGVYADVLAFYFVLGITTSGSAGGASSNAQIAETLGNTHGVAWQSLYPMSAMTGYDPFWLYIGDKMRFYGVITSLSITYSHWNEKMVPMRCEVDLGMSFQPDPSATVKTIKRHYKTKNKTPSSNLPGGNH